MDQVQIARNLFHELESKKRASGELALRNFEIQSRLAKTKTISN